MSVSVFTKGSALARSATGKETTRMDATLIRKFIESTQNVFGTMLQSTVSFGAPAPTGTLETDGDVSGIIGFSGEVAGAAVIRMPMETALGAVESFCGERFAADTEDFSDAIGELANMICGGAKSNLENSNIDMSCPQVVIGSNHTVQTPSDAVSITIPCTAPQGVFWIEVSIRAGKSAAGAADQSRAAAG